MSLLKIVWGLLHGTITAPHEQARVHNHVKKLLKQGRHRIKLRVTIAHTYVHTLHSIPHIHTACYLYIHKYSTQHHEQANTNVLQFVQ